MITTTSWILTQEARALLTRLNRVKPFALLEPMVPAATISIHAQTAIERHLMEGRRELKDRVNGFLEWLHGPGGHRGSPAEAQRRFSFLRMRFNAVLAQFDIFADVITQRSEHENGVWLAGLDAVAADALTLPGNSYLTPPVICYLDRGFGAAIRRARTRLPGGGENPVAIIRVPRERMVGSGIASSLVHEVGHQASALLDLVGSLRPPLQAFQRGEDSLVWWLWERWISEILADFWSVAKVGVASTRGLMGVVSLPRAFVFRFNPDDPHPSPWIRVQLSCAMGRALFPHPQWTALARLWESFYPLEGLDSGRHHLFRRLLDGIPSFVSLLLDHRPRTLQGQTLREALAVEGRQPWHLAAQFRRWKQRPVTMKTVPPALAFAVLGQATADGKLSPEQESRLLEHLLTFWALKTTLDTSALCAARPVTLVTAPAA